MTAVRFRGTALESENYPEVRNMVVCRYPDLQTLYPSVEEMQNRVAEQMKQFAEQMELANMNPIQPDEMNDSRQSGNDELTALENMESDSLTAARACLVANEIRSEVHVKNAEAVHVNHRHGLEEYYQVNVVIDGPTLTGNILDRFEEDYNIEAQRPQATEEGNLLMQYRVPDVEVNEADVTGNEAILKDEKKPLAGDLNREDEDLTKVSGVGHTKEAMLKNAGYHTIGDLADANQSDIASVVDIGNALAARIKADIGYEVTR